MNILVLNAGSGSQKCSLFQLGDTLPNEPLEPLWKGSIESTFPGQSADEFLLRVEPGGQSERTQILPANISHAERIEKLLTDLRVKHPPILNQQLTIDVVGHRVVHGGAEFREAVQINDQVEAGIRNLSAFAPLHNPPNLEGIRVIRKLLGPDVPQIAIFDTSFHWTLPDAA